MPKTEQNYVASLAGLRAIAVLMVIAYHLHLPYISSGFVGVDVFFVISGFVVAHSVIDKEQAGFKSYVAWFYRRRFLRILPAVYAYILVASLMGMLFIPTGEGVDTSISFTGLSALFSLSNVYLLFTSGTYFATGTNFNLFTHTWSLAVEEQYYVLFPFFSYLLLVKQDASRRSRNATAAAVCLACVLSLIASFFFTRKWNSFAFYMIPTRFWELGLGFLLRWQWLDKCDAVMSQIGRTGREILSLVFVAMVAIAAVKTDPHTFPFPGALLPCIATAGILALTWRYSSTLSSVLSLRPLTYIGDISYSLYLWHWGVIVLMLWTVGIDTPALRLVALALTLALSVMSYHLVEQTTRNSSRLKLASSPQFFRFFAALTAVMLLWVLGTRIAKPYAGLSVSNNLAVWNPREFPKNYGVCPVTVSGTSLLRVFSRDVSVFTYQPRCASHLPRVWVIGDSHANAYARMMYRLAADDGNEIKLYSKGGCSLLSFRPTQRPCGAFWHKAMDDVETKIKPGDVVFLPGLYTPELSDAWGDVSSEKPRVDAESLAESKSRLNILLASGARVLIEAPKPQVRTATFRCADWFTRQNSYCKDPGEMSHQQWDAYRASVLHAEQGLAAGSGQISIWDPFPILCPGTTCTAYQNGKPLYYDNHHLSAFGNDILYPSFRNAVRQILSSERPPMASRAGQ